METFFKDLRYGIRSLLKQPAFTLVAVGTLALAIGGNTAMFSVVNAVLLRPLQYPEPDRIVTLEGINPPRGITDSNMSIPDFFDWQSQNQVFEQMAGFVTGGMVLNTGEEAERVRGGFVSADFFKLFRTTPLRGRTLQPDDAQTGKEPVTVLGYGLWQRRFGGDESVLGRKVIISGKSTTIVGVMPQGFDYPAQSEAWAPFPLDPKEERFNRFLSVIARMKPGVSVTQAQAQMDTINQRLAQSYNDTNDGWGVRVRTLQATLVNDVRLSLLVLLYAVAFVLLIACANIANLLLARATSRQKEIAVRAALGASRLRIVRQLLTESLLISFLGGVLGLALSFWLTRLLIAISPPNTPRFDEVRPDGRLMLFAFGLALLTGLVFGLAPALQASRINQSEGLKKSSRGNSGSARSDRLRGFLMAGEIAMSFVLLVGAGLLIKSFIHLREVKPGLNAESVLTMRVAAPPGKFREDAQRAQFFQQVIERVQSIPGVQATGMILSLPLGADAFNVWRGYIPEGRPATREEAGDAAYLPASPDYFRALQIPLIAGRNFTNQDTENMPRVVIINETMARKAWPGQSPIGKHITIWRDEKFPREIVGVVGETKVALENEPGEQMYVPHAQDASWGSMSFVIRTGSSDPTSVVSAARNEIRGVDKGAPIFNVRTMNDVLATSVAPRRAPMLVLAAFAAVALLLAMIGIYGVTAYYVTQRTHEIGIRMALGAQMSDVLKLVLKGGMVLAVFGVAVGLLGAFVLTRWMKSLLFEVRPTDWLTLVAVSVGMLITALLACYLPARRATKVDPLVALRYE
jgi:putative ABC transport system permease protein